MRKLTVVLLAVILMAAPLNAMAETQKAASFNQMYADVSARLLLKTAKPGENTLISPVSVFAAMSMAQNGAKGTTRTEMINAFSGVSAKKTTDGVSSLIRRVSGSKSMQFISPCSIWYRTGEIKLKSSYRTKVSNAFGAEINGSKFDRKTVDDINAWAAGKTNDKIRNIIRRLDDDTMLLLINATCFKAAWAEQYPNSVKRNFTNSGGRTKKAAMLEMAENNYFEIDGAKGFSKLYRGGDTAFVAILPPKGMTPQQFLKKTTGSAIRKAYLNREKAGVTVKTRIPKFRYSFSTSLVKPFISMGIRKAFTDDADFSGMSDMPLLISDIVHKTFIDLNENGTEAAAVTAVIFDKALAPRKMEEKKVYLNRPFIYQIVETKTGLPLFEGIINQL